MPTPEQAGRPARGLSHRTAFLATLLTVLAFFVPMLVRGEVLLGEGLTDEISARLAKVNDSERTRAFRDQLVAYLPQLEHQLHARRSGWLATWNSAVEQGRPPWHLAGFSRAFVLTNVLAWFIDDPFWLYTALALAAVFACAGFGYGLLRSLELGPAACYAGSVGLALGVYVSFWLTFALYIWGVAWALSILWLAPLLLERPLKRGGWTLGLGFAFCVHGLLLTSYPQQTVWSGWLVLLVLIQRLARMPGGARARLAGLGRLALFGALGLVSVAPVFLDLVHAASQSSHATLDAAYFLQPLPSLAGAADWGNFLARLYDASWFGDPVDHTYPFRVKGVSITPLFAVLCSVCLVLGDLRRIWPWLVFLAVTFVMTVVPSVYEFGIDHLGLGISRHVPLAGAHVPLMVVGALAAERLLRGRTPGRALLLALGLLPVLVAGIGVALGDAEIDSGRVALSCGVLLASLLFLLRPRPLLLAGLVLFAVFSSSHGLVLSRPRQAALQEFAFASEVRARLEPGERYLWIADRFRYLVRPNQELLFGLSSVHTYNSLCSRRYRDWAASVSETGLETQGKQFRRLDSAARLDAETLALAGVGLVISGLAHDEPFLEPDGKLKLLTFYTPELPALFEAQFTAFELEQGEARVTPAAVRAATAASGVTRGRDEGDLLEFTLAARDEPSLLFVGQQWHAHWRASSGGVALECVPVQGLYQGVLLPPGTTDVRLEFRPWVRWAWVPQLLFALAGLAALLRKRRGISAS